MCPTHHVVNREKSEYDILVTAAPEHLPDTLRTQLVEGGVLVIPVGAQSQSQRLQRYVRRGSEILASDLGAVRFVPMVRVPTVDSLA